MSSLPESRNRLTLTRAGLAAMATGAAAAAVMPGLFTLGAQLGGVAESAEVAAGAILDARSGWMLPAAFTVAVFACVVGASFLLSRVAVARTQLRRQRDLRGARGRFELREPERALRVRIDRLPGITE